MTDITTSEGNILESEVSIFGQDSQLSNNLESPMGKAGNLTKSMLQVVLAQKPLTWQQVIHERLKHLIISSETF